MTCANILTSEAGEGCVRAFNWSCQRWRSFTFRAHSGKDQHYLFNRMYCVCHAPQGAIDNANGA